MRSDFKNSYYNASGRTSTYQYNYSPAELGSGRSSQQTKNKSFHGKLGRRSYRHDGLISTEKLMSHPRVVGFCTLLLYACRHTWFIKPVVVTLDFQLNPPKLPISVVIRALLWFLGFYRRRIMSSRKLKMNI